MDGIAGCRAYNIFTDPVINAQYIGWYSDALAGDLTSNCPATGQTEGQELLGVTGDRVPTTLAPPFTAPRPRASPLLHHLPGPVLPRLGRAAGALGAAGPRALRAAPRRGHPVAGPKLLFRGDICRWTGLDSMHDNCPYRTLVFLQYPQPAQSPPTPSNFPDKGQPLPGSHPRPRVGFKPLLWLRHNGPRRPRVGLGLDVTPGQNCLTGTVT